MSNLENLTVIIVTYRTNHDILDDCINSIDKNVKILIVENSSDFDFRQKYENTFNNVSVVLSNKNLGYGGGNNSGGYSGGGYGGGNSEPRSSYTNKSSGAAGWEDRSYGNSSENSEYESGRSRRKRGVSNESNSSNEEN